MQEQMTENNARIEELEGQLMALMDKQQLIINDLEFMESQYELTYRKHLNAIEKLEKRRAELQKEKQEHNRAQKELRLTKLALEQSSNKSTQLYAQAVQVSYIHKNWEESVTQRFNSVKDDVNKIFSYAMKFNEENKEYLENYTIYAKESGEKHLTTIEAKYVCF
uniref:Uncharacterized protein n=1 Tax=Panagrolaimus davidi TaxID=227884 RepID=A0A914R719_9BILA